jgi:cyclophilin family peptidyl-prolyl cis-trans isomerase
VTVRDGAGHAQIPHDRAYALWALTERWQAEHAAAPVRGILFVGMSRHPGGWKGIELNTTTTRRRLRTGLFALTAFSALTGTAAAQDAAAPQTPAEWCASAQPAEPATRTFTGPEDVLEPGTDYRAIMCTSAGPIYLDLFEALTPVTVNSFVFLAENDYYDSTTFHRVIADFMAQGGDPTATGSGDPGYAFEDEFIGFLNFDQPGWLAMANAGPGTNGSQFFITTAPTPHLDNRHTIFGRVLEGQETVQALELRDPAAATTPGSALENVLIITDPASVTTTYVAPESAARADVEAVFEGLTGMIQPPLALDEAHGIFEADAVAASAGEALSADYAAFLAEHGFEYRARTGLVNAGCDVVNVPFFGVRYTLDSYPTREAAAAALADGFYQQLPTADGFTALDESPAQGTVWVKDTTACETAATQAIMFWQRGHFVVTAEASFDAASSATPDLYLTELVGNLIYETVLSDILRPEI